MASEIVNATTSARRKITLRVLPTGASSSPAPTTPASSSGALYDDTLPTAVRGPGAAAEAFEPIDLSAKLQPLPFGYQAQDLTLPFRPGERPESLESLRDVFAIPCEEGHVVYAPLQRKALLVRHASGEELAWTDELWTQVCELAGSPTVDLWALERELNAEHSRPTEAVLIPTEGCNLRCQYCYSSATNSRELLDVDVALAGLERCAEEVAKQGLPVLTCRFLGGGEPTIHWKLIQACTARTRELAEQYGVRSGVSLVTNGVLSEDKARWIGENIDSVTLSIDGPPSIHNRNRPKANGKPSDKEASRTLRILQASKCKVDVRSTVLVDDLPRMREIVQYFHEEFALDRLCLEPVSICGRAKDGKLAAPIALEFSRHFLPARAYGRELGMDIEYSSAVLSRLQLRFCTTMGRHFGLNPDGSVSSCSEVHSRADANAPLLVVGEMRGEELDIDTSQVERLKQRTLDNLPSCSHCFARFHCTGGCPMRAARSDGDFFGPFKTMCGAIRTLLGDELLHVVRSQVDGRPA